MSRSARRFLAAIGAAVGMVAGRFYLPLNVQLPNDCFSQSVIACNQRR